MAAVLAGAVTYLFYRQMRSSAAGQRKVTQIVAAATALSPGVTLMAKDIVMIDWPIDVTLPGSFANTRDVVGRALIYSMGAKEPILLRELAVEGSGLGLSVKIPTGMRATAVRSNEIVGVAGFLYPGSHVDVLATYSLPGSSGPITQTVLQNVEVLTAGQTIEPDPQGKPQTVNVVTLLLSPEDSQKLLLTSSQGTIQFVLRSGADQTKAEINPTRMDQLGGFAKPAAPLAATTKKTPKPAAPPAPQVYVLEVIQGTQRNTQKF